MLLRENEHWVSRRKRELQCSRALGEKKQQEEKQLMRVCVGFHFPINAIDHALDVEWRCPRCAAAGRSKTWQAHHQLRSQ